jgi:hypothetical protein
MKNSRHLLLAFLTVILLGGGFALGDDHKDGRSNHESSSCQLNLGREHNKIKHVIYIQFDNTHFRRDNPNVPSDLEQMPSLLNFIRNNGTLLTNDHTVLISHTAGGILSSLTGVYPDRHGQTVRLLDGSRLGHGHPDGAEHDHARRDQRAGTLGAVHARGL